MTELQFVYSFLQYWVFNIFHSFFLELEKSTHQKKKQTLINTVVTNNFYTYLPTLLITTQHKFLHYNSRNYRV